MADNDRDPADIAQVFSRPEVAQCLKQLAPGLFGAASGFWRSALSAPVLSPRMKELVLLALHATATAVDSEGIRRHITRALAAGASEHDIFDVLVTITGIPNHALYWAVPVLVRELGLAEGDLPALTPEVQAIKDEMVRARGFWNPQRDIVARLMPSYFAALSQVATQPWKNGALTEKERELVCIAIDVSVTHMYEPGLVIHLRQAMQKGATRQEILEVFHLAAMTGLEGFILGAEALYGADPPSAQTP